MGATFAARPLRPRVSGADQVAAAGVPIVTPSPRPPLPPRTRSPAFASSARSGPTDLDRVAWINAHTARLEGRIEALEVRNASDKERVMDAHAAVRGSY